MALPISWLVTELVVMNNAKRVTAEKIKPELATTSSTVRSVEERREKKPGFKLGDGHGGRGGSTCSSR